MKYVGLTAVPVASIDIDLKKGSRKIHQLSYGDFDAKGNVMFRAHNYYDSAGKLSLAFSEDFTYDTLNRIGTRNLTVGSGSLTGYSYNEQYNYDGFGNIKSRKGDAEGRYSVNLARYDHLQTTSVNRLNSATVDGKNYSQLTMMRTVISCQMAVATLFIMASIKSVVSKREHNIPTIDITTTRRS